MKEERLPMEIAYLNVNDFCGTDNKKECEKDSEKRKKTAEEILKTIFSKVKPNILFFAEFDAESEAGKFVTEKLEEKGYDPVYPNQYTKARMKYYSSVVVAFTKRKKVSEPSPNKWLKWNEITMDGYRIVGVHIPFFAPNNVGEWKKAEDYWQCLKTHYEKYNGKEKILYIGDMNVDTEGTPGKTHLNEILEKGAADVWIATGHSKDKAKDYTFVGKTRVDYAIASPNIPISGATEMYNCQDFFINELSDHSLIVVRI